MKKIYLPLFLAFAIMSFTQTSQAQVTLQTDISVESLVNDYFNSGTLVTISNITYNGEPASEMNAQIAYFANGLSDGLDLDDGLVMATAAADVLIGEWSNLSFQYNDDPDIMTIGQGAAYTCAVLEFDVLVNADALAFDFIFASTEYQSFTCSQFNDAFGFFVSGPGISGPFSNNSVNIALIPDSETPIAINTVNGGPSTTNHPIVNCELANPNWLNDTTYFVQNNVNQNSSISMNGYTVNFEALVDVVNGETYHMKLAICNIMDGALQSAVLLGAGSFEGRLASNTTDLAKNEMVLYPNPARESLIVENTCQTCSGNLQFIIQDLQGRKVAAFSEAVAERIEIPVAALETGIYIISTWSGNQLIETGKFVKD